MCKRFAVGFPVLGLLLAAGCGKPITPIGPGQPFEPDEREKRLWQTTDEMSKGFQSSGKLVKDPALQAYVQSVLDRLLGGRPEDYAPLHSRVYVLDAPSINAFALSNGDIYLHSGILGRMRNEAQLAMVLGHEMTHNTHRHLYQRYEQAYSASGAYSYVAVLSALGGGNIQSAVNNIGALMMVASISGYSRDKEEESDRVGLMLVAQAGYDPREGAKMFHRMLAATDKGDRGWNFFYATHPKMKERFENCTRLAEQLPPELAAKAKNLGQDQYLDVTVELIHNEVERQIAQGKYSLAEETLAFLFEARPRDADTHSHRGDLYRARGGPGDMEQAKAAYERALSLDSHQAHAHRGLGLLLARQGEKPAAIEHLQKYVEEAGDASDVSYIRKYIEQLSPNP